MTEAKRRGHNLLKDDRKVERILTLWNLLCCGRRVSREEMAQSLKVNERTVSRYFSDIRHYLGVLEEIDGIHRELILDRKTSTYRITEMGNRFITHGELFAVCKILLASKAFHKEEMKSLLSRLLQNSVSAQEKEEINRYIKNEIFEYQDPSHKNPDMDVLWDITNAAHTHNILSFDYQKIGAEMSSPHVVRPLGVLFSEYYFYLAARPDRDIRSGSTSPVKIYRLDRMSHVKVTDSTFDVPYTDRFKEGEFKNQVQFMYSGPKIHLEFIYSGPSIEAVLDRLPTAKAKAKSNGSWIITADIQGEGILMWLLSQGANVNVLAPETLRNEWLATAQKICEMGKA